MLFWVTEVRKGAMEMKKGWKSLLLPVMLVLLFSVAICAAKPVSAAQKVNLNRGHFYLYYGGTDGVIVKLKLPYSNIKAEVAFYLNGKKIATGVSNNYVAYKFAPKKNQIYTYRVRALYNNKPIGSWSKHRAFSTMMYNTSLPSSSSTMVRFALPKNSKVKSSVLYLSTSKDSGFKRVATVKPGGYVNVSSFNGSAFVRYKNYYHQAKVTLKSGYPCDTIFYSYFYIYLTNKGKGLGTSSYGIDSALISALAA